MLGRGDVLSAGSVCEEMSRVITRQQEMLPDCALGANTMLAQGFSNCGSRASMASSSTWELV